jgi:hypothetical protein
LAVVVAASGAHSVALVGPTTTARLVIRWPWHRTKLVAMRDVNAGHCVWYSNSQWVRVLEIWPHSDGWLQLNVGAIEGVPIEMPILRPDDTITVKA